MRLALVLFHWFPYGGLQRDLVKIVTACQPHAEIEIFCQRWDGEQLPGVPTHVLPPKGWGATARRRHFVACVQAAVQGKFDRVIGFNRMPGLDYYFAADTSFAWRAMHQRNWLYRMTPRARQYLAFEKAVFGRHVSTVSLLLSNLQRQQYEEMYHPPAHRLVDLPPGISQDHCAGENAARLRASLRDEFQLQEDELLVLQVGSSFRTKGVDRSLQALAALPAALRARVHYILLGQDNAAPWRKQAQKLGLKGVHIEAGRTDIPRCMQGADVLLHPSRHESAGMVLLEAVVAGLPVLTTAACGYAMHVENAEAGLVCAEPFHQDALNAHLEYMLTTDRSSWRAKGIDYGKSHDLYAMPQRVADILLASGGGHD